MTRLKYHPFKLVTLIVAWLYFSLCSMGALSNPNPNVFDGCFENYIESRIENKAFTQDEMAISLDQVIVTRSDDVDMKSLTLLMTREALNQLHSALQRWLSVEVPAAFLEPQADNPENKPSGYKTVFFDLPTVLMKASLVAQSNIWEVILPLEQSLTVFSHPYLNSGKDSDNHHDWKHYDLKSEGWYSIPIVSGLLFQGMQSYLDSGLKPSQQRDDLTVPLIHALITGIGSNYLYFSRNDTYLNRVIKDVPPENLLEIILPLITWGYGGYDLYDAVLHNQPEFILHGSSILLITKHFADKGRVHLLSDALILETPTIFLNLRRVNSNFMYAFAASFFIYRWGIIPVEWFRFLKAVYRDGQRYPNDETLNPAILWGGAVINGMNLFWGIKILQMIKRMTSGA